MRPPKNNPRNDTRGKIDVPNQVNSEYEKAYGSDHSTMDIAIHERAKLKPKPPNANAAPKELVARL